MLASNDVSLINKARFLAAQARDPAPHYEHTEIGYNYRMSNILAAIGLGQLSCLDDRVARRRQVFELYRKALSDLPGISFMPEPYWSLGNRWLTAILVAPDAFGADREQIRLSLNAENIESRPLWKPLHLQPVFKSCRFVGGGVSARLFSQGLCLPSGTMMSDSEILRVCDIVRQCQA